MGLRSLLQNRILPLLAVNFIGALGMSIVLPFLVFLVEDFGGNGVVYGLMGATYPFFQFIFGPVLGNWSDRWGRKRILLLSQAGTLLSWCVFLFALLLPVTQIHTLNDSLLGSISITIPLVLLFVARAFDGLTGGNVAVANAYLADISDDSNRQRNFGLMSAAANLGFILGPAIAGLLSGFGPRGLYPVIGAIVISITGLLIIIAILPEAPVDPEEAARDTKADHSFSQIMRIKGVFFLMVLYFLIYLGFNFFYTAYPVHSQQGLGWNELHLGFYFSALSLLMLLVQGPGLSLIGGRFRDAGMIVVGALLLSVNFFLIMTGKEIPTYAALFFFASGNGIMWPSFLAILSKVGKKRQQGTIQGIAASGGSLASIVGLVSGGFLYTQIGPWTFGVAGVIILFVAFLSFRLFAYSREEHHDPDPKSLTPSKAD